MALRSRAIVAAVCAICVIGIGCPATADDTQPAVSQKTGTETTKDAFCALAGVPDNTPCPKGCRDGGCEGTCQAGFCKPPPPQ